MEAMRRQWSNEQKIVEVIGSFQSGKTSREEYEAQRKEIERWHESEGRWKNINGRWHFVKGKVDGAVWNPQDFLLMAETDFDFRRREGLRKLAATTAEKDGFGRNKKRVEYARIEDERREVRPRSSKTLTTLRRAPVPPTFETNSHVAMCFVKDLTSAEPHNLRRW